MMSYTYELTDTEKSQYDVIYLWTDSDTEKSQSVWCHIHYDVTDKNNTVSFEDIDIQRMDPYTTQHVI
jgi:hypothetical protein